MLIGQEIHLTPAVTSDAAMLASWWSDPEYRGDYYNVWPDSVEEWERDLGQERDFRKEGFFVIRDRRSDEPIGTAGYVSPFAISLHQGLELWYQVHPSRRRQRVATKAACLLVNHLFGSLTVERIQATVVVGNEGSRNVALAAGLQEDGVLRHATWLRGSWRDMHLLSILRDEWQDEATYRATRRPF